MSSTPSLLPRAAGRVALATLAAAVLGGCQGTPEEQSAPTPLTESKGGGLFGYISMDVPPPPPGFGLGISFYSAAWPLLDRPLESFQIGLPGTWIIPDNRDYERPLCPPGTYARDHWPERGPSYRDVFQTIEGGMGFWVSTQYGSPTPKYRMNGTPNCYDDQVSSPGWSFGEPEALHSGKMGLAQISNRLVVPPDGLTFEGGLHGELFGTAWMALPFLSSSGVYHRQPTGDLSWTLFLSAGNFKGPVAFWIPDTWSAIAHGHADAAGRTLDVREAVMGGGAMEVNTVPFFRTEDQSGIVYSRIPQLLFPVDPTNRTVLMQDVVMYSRDALFDAVGTWSQSKRAVTGEFDERGAHRPTCTNRPLSFEQDGVQLFGFDAFVETTMFPERGSCTFGLAWKGSSPVFPAYFKRDGHRYVAIHASDVPPETGLAAQSFAPPWPGRTYTSRTGPETAWSTPGPAAGPLTLDLADGSRVTCSWYRFVDQPALQHLGLDPGEKARVQSLVERIHSHWPITRDYMAPPSQGTLATLDPALIVTPPQGLEVGYVPIVTRQEAVQR